MQSRSAPELLQIEASDALLSALVKLTAAGTTVVVLSRDEAFELAALRYLTARALHIAARCSEPAGA
jgi:hypothetical protein